MDNQINLLTASMLMNKTSYNKYLEKTSPKLHKEKQDFLHKLKLYKRSIRDLVTDYLENPEKDFSLEVNTSLYDLGKSAIKYFEIINLDKTRGEGYDEGCYETDDPDDSLFTNMETDTEATDETEYKKNTKPSYSFWGKPIKKSTDFIGVYGNNDTRKYTKKMETSEKNEKQNKKNDGEYENEYDEYDETKERENTEEELA